MKLRFKDDRPHRRLFVCASNCVGITITIPILSCFTKTLWGNRLRCVLFIYLWGIPRLSNSDLINVSDRSPFLLRTIRSLRKAFRIRTLRVSVYYVLSLVTLFLQDKYFIHDVVIVIWYFIHILASYDFLHFRFSVRLRLLLENVKAKLYCIDNARRTTDIR